MTDEGDGDADSVAQEDEHQNDDDHRNSQDDEECQPSFAHLQIGVEVGCESNLSQRLIGAGKIFQFHVARPAIPATYLANNNLQSRRPAEEMKQEITNSLENQDGENREPDHKTGSESHQDDPHERDDHGYG